jgi:hypothetical protein
VPDDVKLYLLPPEVIQKCHRLNLSDRLIAQRANFIGFVGKKIVSHVR